MTTYTIAAIAWSIASMLASVLEQAGRAIGYAMLAFVLFNMPL